MAKTAPTLDLALADPRPGSVLLRWLYDEIRSAILDGRLRRGARLPSTRSIAARYGVSRGTVVAAFNQLQSEGYLEGRVGEGTHIKARLPEDFLTAGTVPTGSARPSARRRALSRLASRLPRVPDAPASVARAFRAEPALEELPLEAWARIASRCLRRAPRSLLSDSDSRGYRPLRDAVASYLGAARGVKCAGDQVVIVAGIQHGLDLTIRLLLDPGDPVCVEDPCHPMVAMMLRVLPARIVPVPVDDRGLDVEAARRRCVRPKLVYVTPAHQFPLGAMLSVDRRLALLDWARRTGAWIFEDDYDSEYRYSGRPIPALQGFDRDGSVIFAGSFSKVLLPGLRLGYLVVPERLTEKFSAARFITDRHSSVIDQAVMCEFLTDGHFARHVRRMRELYAHRLEVLRESVREKLAGALELPETPAGILAVGWLAAGLNAETVAKAAAERHVEVTPVGRYALEWRGPEGLVLGFAAVGDRELHRGVDVLAAVLEASGQSSRDRAQGIRDRRAARRPRRRH